MTIASLVFAASSCFLVAASHIQQPWVTSSAADSCKPNNPLPAAGTYYGLDNKGPTSLPTRLRISNGGAGLSGLVGALADAFITYKVNTTGEKPFKIEWIKGDTTETLSFLGTGQADVGITYNKAAECQAVADRIAARRVYGFRDHFYLVGPGPKDKNPAGLREFKRGKHENVLTQFQKIVRTGNNEAQTPPTRFLSRYDKSATNIKDSELFITIGQVPWALAYSKWYHQYTMYPIDALIAAALLGEYTITDRGTWLSTPRNITGLLVRYNEGQDDPNQNLGGKGDDPADPLLNPAFFLTSTRVCEKNKQLADEFLNWTIGEDGQKVIEDFRGRVSGDKWLYTRAPTRNDLRIQNCSVAGT